MWDCLNCGCKAVIVVRCPMCGTERNMARSTVEGGYSDQYEPADPADDQDPDEAVPVVEDDPGHDPDRGNGSDPAAEETVPAASDNTDAASDYSSYSVRDLVELCKARGIAYSGPAGTLPKDALAARLSEPPKE